MPKPFCEKHPDVEPICYCPACRGAGGGTKAAARMSKKARIERAKKAAAARYAKEAK
jgi:hypothetical protein